MIRTMHRCAAIARGGAGGMPRRLALPSTRACCPLTQLRRQSDNSNHSNPEPTAKSDSTTTSNTDPMSKEDVIKKFNSTYLEARFDPFALGTSADHLAIHASSRSSLQLWAYQFWFDQRFDESEFLRGARQAFLTVNHLFYSNRFDDLKPMVSEELLTKMKSEHDKLVHSNLVLQNSVESFYNSSISNLFTRTPDTYNRYDENVDTLIDVTFFVKETSTLRDQTSGQPLDHFPLTKPANHNWRFRRSKIGGKWHIVSCVIPDVVSTLKEGVKQREAKRQQQ